MKDREKEIKYLIYVKNEIIKQQKKELKNLRNELEKIDLDRKKAKSYRKFK